MEIQKIVARQPEQFFANNKSFNLRILSREAEIIGQRFCISTERVRFSSHQVFSTCQIEGDPGPDWVYFSVRKNTNSSLLIGRAGVSRGGFAVSILGSAGMAVTGAGYASFTVGVQRDLLLSGSAILPGQRVLLQKSTTYRIKEALFNYLNVRLRELERKNAGERPMPEREFERQTVEIFTTLLSCLDARAEIVSGNRQRIVHTSSTYIADNPHRKVSTQELAKASFCSVRTLQYAFRTTVGISPKSYGDRYRLSLFREALLEAGQRGCYGQRIHELGQRFGFTHPGNLAKTYRELFGRLPSQDCGCDSGVADLSDQNSQV